MTRLLSISFFLFVLTTQFTNAAPQTNLLKGHNPSFEQGMANWRWGIQPDTFQIVERQQPIPSCGVKFLRITHGEKYNILISDTIRVREDGQYKFTIRARVKRAQGQNAFVSDIWAWMVKYNGSGPLYSIAHNVKSTNGKWIEYSGTIQSDKEEYPRIGFYIEFQINKGGKIDFDCAKIERLS